MVYSLLIFRENLSMQLSFLPRMLHVPAILYSQNTWWSVKFAASLTIKGDEMKEVAYIYDVIKTYDWIRLTREV
jgi:hypothetical protein